MQDSASSGRLDLSARLPKQIDDQSGFSAEGGTSARLRLLSFNLQSGLKTMQPRDYLTKGWQHFVPHPDKQTSLDQVAGILPDYDVVALQEVDAGSMRSAYLDQVGYLAEQADFPYSYKQVNRNIGQLAQYSNGFLSRFQPDAVHCHKLPGLPGRGVMVLDFKHQAARPFSVLLLHMALGKRGQQRQFGFVSELLQSRSEVAIMGDLNCKGDSAHLLHFLEKNGLRDAMDDEPTYPSWAPHKNIDHILVSESLKTDKARVVDFRLSDHLPVSVELELPR